MTYEEICKYVFLNENFDWALRDSKKRDRGLVYARQISIFIGNSFHPKETWATLGKIFGRDHATAMHAVRNVKDLMFSDPLMRQKILKYCSVIKLKTEEKKELDLKSILAVRDTETLNSLLTTIDKMELIARIYCEVTGQEIVKTKN